MHTSLIRRVVVAAGALALAAGSPALLAAPQEATAPPAISAPAAEAPPPAAPPSAEVSALRRDLDRLIREPGWSSARYGVLVVSLDRGDTLFALNPDQPLVPASNLKLYSTASALYYLGPEFRYSTYFLADGEVRDSVLDGDLILYGTGDPSISARMLSGAASTFREIADSVRARGIREIRGDIVGDGSYFDAAGIAPGWNPDDLMAWYGAPIGALSFAENLVSVRVMPGQPGQPARVTTSPETEAFNLSNNVQTVSSGGTSVRFEHGAEGIIVSGRIRRGHAGVVRSMPVVDPAGYAAAAFHAALEEQGVRVTGGSRAVHDPEASRVGFGRTNAVGASPASPPRVLYLHLSPSLAEIIKVTNQISHNLYAEALLKLSGRIALGDGSFAGGARAVRYMLECETGLDAVVLSLSDGSGLSRLNQVTPRSTVQLLDFMTGTPAWDAFYGSLPIAADAPSHSLRYRMGRSPAAGNLRAKTGTIKKVSSLSGYVTAANGERLAFSIIANNVPSTWRAKRTEDAIGVRLASFRRPPPPEPAAGDIERPSPGAEAGGPQMQTL